MSAVNIDKPRGGGLPSGAIVLDAQSVTKQFGGLTAVNDVTFPRSRSSRSSAPTAPARRRSSTS
jgi:hypothetical protein